MTAIRAGCKGGFGPPFLWRDNMKTWYFKITTEGKELYASAVGKTKWQAIARLELFYGPSHESKYELINTIIVPEGTCHNADI